MLNIYIADLQAYNNGYLKGQWVELPVCETELDEILSTFPSDYAIHDYESTFTVHEYTNVYRLNDIAAMMLRKGYSYEMLNLIDEDINNLDAWELDTKLSEICVHHYTGDKISTSLERIKKDFAYEYMVEFTEFNPDDQTDEIKNNINWLGVFEDLEQTYDIYISEDNLKVYFKS